MNKALACAVRLLTRREHGAHELFQKLWQKGYAELEIQQAIEECKRLELQSDTRFAESICRIRIRQGYGPLRIQKELQNARVERDLIESVLQQEEENWITHAVAVWKKKYQKSDVDSGLALQKQKQFLLYRGFPAEIITSVFRVIK